jgi:hypothetical protein
MTTAPTYERVALLDEAPARSSMRAQIARLETDLAALGAAPASRPAERRGSPGPRLLSLAELEALRDRLDARLRRERLAAAEPADRQEAIRRLREEALLDPAAHPHVRVSNAAVGEPGCRDWHVRPRLGLLGMLMRWWRVVVSSGCP